ncbi:hypothetical protein BN871_CQ_00180 [Paenibacillus sp. P22]|nr:hypothetical protein BN871_CQ_00180 [Paenibacillus sp. P22]
MLGRHRLPVCRDNQAGIAFCTGHEHDSHLGAPADRAPRFSAEPLLQVLPGAGMLHPASGGGAEVRARVLQQQPLAAGDRGRIVQPDDPYLGCGCAVKLRSRCHPCGVHYYSPCLFGRISGIYGYRRSRDPLRPVACQPYHRFGYIPRRDDGIERHGFQIDRLLVAQPDAERVGHDLGHMPVQSLVVVHRARADGVDPYVPGGVVQRRRLGQSHQAVLRGDVAGKMLVTEQPRGRRDIDDAPVPLLQQDRSGRLDDPPWSRQIDVEQNFPFLALVQMSRLAGWSSDAGVVDNRVDAAEPADRLLHELPDVVHLAHIREARHYARSGFAAAADGRLELVGRGQRIRHGIDGDADIREDEIGALLGGQNRAGSADAAAGSGNENDLVFEPSHVDARPPCRRAREP